MADEPSALKRVLGAHAAARKRAHPGERSREVELDPNNWVVQCLAHDDGRPSLSVSYKGGRVLLHCFAGCEHSDVMTSLGLERADLDDTQRVDAEYRYCDEDGALRYVVVREWPKAFKQKRPDPDRPKRWLHNLRGVEPLPYRLPELATALKAGAPIYVVEGERDVETMRETFGVVATTNSGGAGKWTEAHAAHFARSPSPVSIVGDRDVAGYRHMLRVRDTIRTEAAIDPAMFLPVGHDVTDHAAAGHSLDALEPVTVKALGRLIEAEGVAKKSVSAGATSSRSSGTPSETRSVVVRAASEHRSQVQRWLWKDRIPSGVVALFAGRGGVGKSSFAIWLAVEAQRGRLAGDFEGERVSVLYVSVEDDWSTQMKPRLMAAHADLDNFYELAIEYSTDDATGERIPSLPADAPLIHQAIEQTGARLVIIDPITSTFGGDDHKLNTVRAVLDPLAQVAKATGATVIGIMHFNKGAGNASDKLSGSHAYRDAARAVMLFARDEDADQIVMTQDKGNYAAHQEMSLAFQLVDSAVLLEDGEIGHVARVEIIGETRTSVQELVNRSQSPVSGVAAWLSEYMASRGGRVPAGEGLAAGMLEGFSETAIGRARRDSRPPVVTNKSDMTGGWVWHYEGVAIDEGVPENTEEVVPSNSDALPTPSLRKLPGTKARQRVRPTRQRKETP